MNGVVIHPTYLTVSDEYIKAMREHGLSEDLIAMVERRNERLRAGRPHRPKRVLR